MFLRLLINHNDYLSYRRWMEKSTQHSVGVHPETSWDLDIRIACC